MPRPKEIIGAVPFQLMLPSELLERVRKQAANQNISAAKLVRDLLEKNIEKSP